MRYSWILLCSALLLANSCALFKKDPTSEPAQPMAIPAIQGREDVSPVNGQRVSTEGIVAGLFPKLGGFTMHSLTDDNNDESSQGIFVVYDGALPALRDVVAITATVNEQDGRTQLQAVESLEVTAQDGDLGSYYVPTPIEDWERYEGMLITLTNTLTVIDNYDLGRYGEFRVAAEGRQYIPTQIIDPNDATASGTSYSGTSNMDGVGEYSQSQRGLVVIVDDASAEQNPETPAFGSFSDPVTVGSTISGITGVVDEAFNRYALLPTDSLTFNKEVANPIAPLPQSANLTVVTFNVENYFNGTGTGGGWSSFGASSQEEFDRQTLKLVEALVLLNADVFAIQEMENDGEGESSSIVHLLQALNEHLGADVYGMISDPAVGTNSGNIRNVFFYKLDRVLPIGEATADQDAVHHRLPLTQLFEVQSNNARVMMSTVHLRSRSCSNASGDDDNNGQGCYNARRTAQIQATYDWMAAAMDDAGVRAGIILGDFNAYSQEDPVDYLRAQNMVSALTDEEYTYVYQGKSGALDHIMLTEALASGNCGGQAVNINADYPNYIDYNTEFNPEGAFMENYLRASDHDPALVYLEVTPSMNRPVAGEAQPLAAHLEVAVYPNPLEAASVVQVNAPKSGLMRLRVLDLQGRPVWTNQQSVTKGLQQVSLPSEGWSAGTYVLQINAAGEHQSTVLVKE